mgnify:CR=1 FL=1
MPVSVESGLRHAEVASATQAGDRQDACPTLGNAKRAFSYLGMKIPGIPPRGSVFNCPSAVPDYGYIEPWHEFNCHYQFNIFLSNSNMDPATAYFYDMAPGGLVRADRGIGDAQPGNILMVWDTLGSQSLTTGYWGAIMPSYIFTDYAAAITPPAEYDPVPSWP